MSIPTDIGFVAGPMVLLFEPKTEPAIDILDVIIKEEPVQNEDCDIFNIEFANTIKTETSEESIEGIDTIEVSPSLLDPLEDTQEFILRKEGGRIKRRRLIECSVCKKKYHTGYIKKHMRTHAEHTDVHINIENEDKTKNGNGDVDGNNDFNDSVKCVTKKNGRRHQHQPIECPVCKKRYHKDSIKRHLEIHKRKEDDKPELTFNERNKALENSNNDTVNGNAEASAELRVYAFYKSGDRIRKRLRLTCPICKNRYADCYMKTHMQTHAENPEDKPQTRQVECEVCKKTLSAQAFPGHMRIHTGEKPFVCPICGREFRRRDRLKEHEVVHSDARPFACTHCNKAFKTRIALKCHVRRHTGEKPFGCQFCGKKFCFSKYLNVHMRVHNTDRQ